MKTRRSFLIGGITVGVGSLAGCTQNADPADPDEAISGNATGETDTEGSDGNGRTNDQSSTLGDWPQANFDDANTNHALEETGPETGVGRAWHVDGGSTYATQPVVADGTVYRVTETHLTALSGADGGERWRVRLREDDAEGRLRTVPVVTDELVLVATGRGVFAHSVVDGSEQWRTDHAARGLTVREDTVYVSTGGFYHRALALSDGSERWATEIGTWPQPSPVSDDAVVVWKGYDIAGLDPADGTVLWEDILSEDVSGEPLIADGTVYATDHGGQVKAFDAASGETLWSHDELYEIKVTAAFAEGTLVVADVHPWVVGIDAATGEIDWTFEVDDWGNVGGLSIADGTVYFSAGGAEGQPRLVAVSLDDGTERWHHADEYVPGYSTPVPVDGNILAHDATGVTLFEGDP